MYRCKSPRLEAVLCVQRWTKKVVGNRTIGTQAGISEMKACFALLRHESLLNVGLITATRYVVRVIVLLKRGIASHLRHRWPAVEEVDPLQQFP